MPADCAHDKMKCMRCHRYLPQQLELPLPPVVGQIEIYHSALEKLARLGNGIHYGNSDGNMIAQRALMWEPGDDPI